jgi:hypothetical protein
VCIGAVGRSEYCFISLEGSGWHNWGLIYVERATRFVKHKATGVQPKRELRMEMDFTVQLRVTNKGRYTINSDSTPLQYRVMLTQLSC